VVPSASSDARDINMLKDIDEPQPVLQRFSNVSPGEKRRSREDAIHSHARVSCLLARRRREQSVMLREPV